MDPVTIAKIGFSALSFLGGRKDAKANRDRGKLDLGALRQEALENGFNPLTVLQATGGQGFVNQGAAPGFLTQIGLAGGMLADDLYNRARDQKNDAIASALMGAQTSNLNAQTAVLGLPSGNRSAAAPVTEVKSFDEWGYIDAWTSSGAPIQVHGGVADRIGLEPGGIWIAEDEEAILGDLGSAPGQVGIAGDSFWQSLKGWFGSETANPYLRRGHSGGAAQSVAPTVVTPPPAPLRMTIDTPAPFTMRDRDPQPGWNSYLGFQ